MMAAPQTSTQATTKTVLFVENDKTIRDSVTLGLEQRGFHAYGVENRSGVREHFEKPHQDVDVVILDINLGDPQSHATGFQVGQEVIDSQPDLPPRRILYTGHDDLSYYEAAVRLGADDYIRKADNQGQKLLYSRVSTSSLVRALSPVRPEISGKIGEIAEKNFDVGVAARYICQEVIAPEVSVCLGLSCVFLYTDADAGRILKPEIRKVSQRSNAWLNIQHKIFDAPVASPYQLSSNDIGSLMREGKGDLSKELDGAFFIPIYDERGFRLSMGILPTDEAEVLREQKSPGRYAQNLFSTVREPIAKEFKYLRQVKATMERTKLRHTSTFCLYVSNTQIDALEESLEKEEIDPENPCFRRLKRLAEDLKATGIEFSRLLDSNEPTATAIPPNVSAQTVVDEAWKLLLEQGVVSPNGLEITHTGSDVQIPVEREDLFVATLRMLEWMAQREDKIAPDASRRAIDVSYERRPGRVAIRFTDHSWQLGERLRKRLFEPFTQGTTTPVGIGDKGDPRPGLYLPLYLAKVLLTVKNDGSLEDRTDELGSDRVGNCFVFAFPVEDN